jgi:hypothetical protein
VIRIWAARSEGDPDKIESKPYTLDQLPLRQSRLLKQGGGASAKIGKEGREINEVASRRGRFTIDAAFDVKKEIPDYCV